MNYFGSLLLDVPAPGGFIVQSSYSSIGYIAAAATGVCLAKRDDQRVMVFSGDGGFQMTAQCLSTQTRFGLNPIIFVIGNGASTAWSSGSPIHRSSTPTSRSTGHASCTGGTTASCRRYSVARDGKSARTGNWTVP
ncbi:MULTISPECIES: thiamine pyrophosphate-dependent enzyme [Kitasatospora]|uniref:thiamine pyrophosphate-dependent enzyme n=1 Tax=Kitasatospora TaxID=2063 RepID=UPI00247456BF|nr:thiamine pyrophosphate-dependent enzyme [Kitasatospora sp. GP30]